MRKRGIDRCESPIERNLFLALQEHTGFSTTPPDTERHPYEGLWWEGWLMVLLVQPTVGKYRPDFIVAPVGPDRDSWTLVVEADGHAFHEKSKTQAARDKKRDRFFQQLGWHVLHFTGSEISRDSRACAIEIAELALKLQREVMDRAFKEWVEEKAKELARTDHHSG
jgi:very-short-patch-repair endonuclease